MAQTGAEKFCQEHGLRYTEPRAAVLSVIQKSDKPIGAYDVLAQLSGRLDNPKPPTIYRAIEFWMGHGFIHKIESLNAFVACEAGHAHKGSQFIVCDGCGDVEEIHLCHLPEALDKKINQSKFDMKRWSAEIHGLCQKCQS